MKLLPEIWILMPISVKMALIWIEMWACVMNMCVTQLTENSSGNVNFWNNCDCSYMFRTWIELRARVIKTCVPQIDIGRYILTHMIRTQNMNKVFIIITGINKCM